MVRWWYKNMWLITAPLLLSLYENELAGQRCGWRHPGSVWNDSGYLLIVVLALEGSK